MITTFCYKLNPSPSQLVLMDEWLSMLRALYNFCLRERIEAKDQARAPILGNYCRLDNKGDCCPLACSVNKTALHGNPWKDGKNQEKILASGKKYNPRRSALMQQDACLPQLKKARPWYQKVNADVLQLTLRRLNTAFNNFFKHNRGYPKPKRRGQFRSFAYKPKQIKIKDSAVYLPGLGWIRFFLSRSLLEGFMVRTVTIKKKSDGWYMAVQLADEKVPWPSVKQPDEINSAIGIDLGLNKLASISNRETIINPRFSKKSEARKARLQRGATRKKQGSKNRYKSYKLVAKLNQKIANQRSDYQWKLANKLVELADLIVFEDLNIKGMTARCKAKQDENGNYLNNGQAAKSGLNKAILDAAWGELKLKVKAVAEKLGSLVLEVNPRHSSQECSHCGYVSPTNRNKEKFLCENCGYYDDADVQASVNILNRGFEILGMSPSQLCGVPAKVTPRPELTETSKDGRYHAGMPGEPGNPRQLNLFEWRKGKVIYSSYSENPRP